jgi:hypothetical protein
MDPLKICSVEFDDRDPYRATFNVHLSRDMTDFERQALPPLLSSGFSPSEARGLGGGGDQEFDHHDDRRPPRPAQADRGRG